ncbi:threonylcarbamoyl-AMP synthase [Candidatus Gottesmanbacteria bacterium RIFCSPHIGHO2_02_FULL_40_13]|uniref:L-threonylcarbamoyladenylate synthase n=1 Tax=Candidatus Gottesmanbacteria bacterium RIFCSPHIGHO2_02_FULL_40_13 TaxID=1798384 RepID=A0A1F6AA22_9BACT|nr:MAG: threonylcarbamoyl-AMP synthase [Candidatus Gottesmanbacteria bacterium RIFCSPHIGHO2_02_FULL_40_13]
MDKIKEAVKILNQGGIIIFPTDTAFGIGCRMDNAISVQKLFKIRRRPESQAVPVLVDSINMAKRFLLSPLPDNVRQLMESYWPGALTVIYPCKKQFVDPLVRGGSDNLGVRMPNHLTALKLISEAGMPILGPSANFHGAKTPYRLQDLDPQLIKLVDYVVPGKCKHQNASTVIDCSIIPWKIKRQGDVFPKFISLHIDTRDRYKAKIKIIKAEKKYNFEEEQAKNNSQSLLQLIDKALKKCNFKLNDLNFINVETKGGSFTGVRIGLAVANTLGWVYGIPVNSKQRKIITPDYA